MVVRVVSLVTELSDSQEAGAQLPLISQQASRMSSQQTAGKAERPAEGLTDLRVLGLYGRRDCNTEPGRFLTLLISGFLHLVSFLFLTNITNFTQ